MSLSSVVPSGVYAITPDGWEAGRIAEVAQTLLSAGVRLLQLRSKHLAPAEREALGRQLRACCDHHAAPLIVNDDVAMAARLGAAGVHLGEEDATLDAARAILGPGAVIGVSCYADPVRAQRLAAAGADYVAFGAVYPTRTKHTPHRARLSLFRDWPLAAVPTVAIGGIQADNAAPLFAAGARWLAMIDALWNASDPAAVVRRIHALLPDSRRPDQ
jgi:thiamine-phosphate pyrophosphorylase